MKWLNLTILTITVYLIFSGIAPTASYSEESKPLTLALNWLPEPQFGGFYQAQFNDVFKKQGLSIEILKGGSGSPTIQMLTKGVVDFAIVSAEEILISNDKNPKNQVLALFATYQTNPQMLMSHKERGFNSIADLLQSEGYLAWQSGLSYSLFLRKKYTQTKVKMVPYLGGLTQFQKDKQLSQQGFITSEPLAAEKLGLKISTFLVSAEGFNPYTTVLAVRKDFFKKNSILVEKMQKSVVQGWDEYLNNPAATNQKMHDLNPGMDLETFAKSAKAQSELIKPKDGNITLGEMKSQRWQELISQMKDLALIKRNLKPDDQFINPTVNPTK